MTWWKRNVPSSSGSRKNWPAASSSRTAALPVRSSRASHSGPVRVPRVLVTSRNRRRYGVELVQDRPGEVGPQQPRAATELGHGPFAVRGRLAPGGQVEQRQPRRPPAGASGQRGRGLGGQRLAVHPGEELLDLPGSEPQRLPVQHRELSGDHQPGDVHRQWSSGGQSDPQQVRAPADQLAELGLGRTAGQLMYVVQEQRDRSGSGSHEAVDQGEG